MDGIKEYSVTDITEWGKILFKYKDHELERQNSAVVLHVNTNGTRIILYPDGSVWTDWKSYRSKAKITSKGAVRLGKAYRSVRKLVATYYLPNPGNMGHVWSIDGDLFNTEPANLKWSTCFSRENLIQKAKQAEKRPSRYPYIFAPKIKKPKTITLKSKV